MPEADGDYTRRRLLQASLGVGVVAGGAGAVTGSYLSDRKLFPDGVVGTQSFSLELATDTADGNDDLVTFSEEDDASFENAATVPVDIPNLEPGERGVVRIGYRLCEDPGWIWVRTTGDDLSGSELGQYLHIRLRERPQCGRSDGDEKDPIPLDDLGGGLPLGVGNGCITCDPVCLDLEWELEANAPADLSGESISLPLEFAAVQCRHHEERPGNPWN